MVYENISYYEANTLVPKTYEQPRTSEFQEHTHDFPQLPRKNINDNTINISQRRTILAENGARSKRSYNQVLSSPPKKRTILTPNYEKESVRDLLYFPNGRPKKVDKQGASSSLTQISKPPVRPRKFHK
ncbi:hypothetical protein JTB14_009907 [Gonioctena quinquepunctata]|nr:hypothetical protein JTB14_009907 [Gonioctena quinquepunctata]